MWFVPDNALPLQAPRTTVTNTDDAPTEEQTPDEPFPLTGPWSHGDMATFLDDTTVPIRVSCRTPSGGLWMLSLWYRYEDGQLWCATGADADIVKFLREDPHVAFEISVNDPPYRGVRGQGTATIEPDPEKATLRSLLERYLGGTDSALAERLLSPEREEVAISIDPTTVATWDYSNRMSDATE